MLTLAQIFKMVPSDLCLQGQKLATKTLSEKVLRKLLRVRVGPTFSVLMNIPDYINYLIFVQDNDGADTTGKSTISNITILDAESC